MTTIDLAIAAALGLGVIFPRTVMRWLRLDPTRASHLFAHLSSGVVVVYLFTRDEFLGSHGFFLLAGLFVGSPSGVIHDRYRLLRRIENDTLHLYPGFLGYAAAIGGLVVGIWAVTTDNFGPVLAFTAGLCVTSMVVTAIQLRHHEATHGPVHIGYGSPSREA